jgi:subtilisin family serine protease
MWRRSERCVIFVVALLAAASAAAGRDDRSTYIVHMSRSAMPNDFIEHGEWYAASLQSVSESATVVYTYDTLVHGYSARLTRAEAEAMASQPGVLLVNPEVRYELHTTRTPAFLGLDGTDSLFPQSGTVSDVVVGVLDTGVWPERPSYDDAGFGPVPTGWKGKCEEGHDFNASACNKKLIGARFFLAGYEAAKGPVDVTKESRSPRDNDGHGTHTSSTAAGAAVPGADLLGYAAGTAKGMAPRARVATYKVCWVGGCFSSDILKAMEVAVADGVDVLSLSLGGGNSDYYRDSLAVGAFSAMEKGIFVSCSAGNAGPVAASLSNGAPWVTTVGAGTLDRDFPAVVALGDGKNYTGVSLYSGKPLPAAPVSFVYAGNVSNSSMGALCMSGSLIPEKVRGKIVLCDRGTSARVQKGFVVRDAGGAGMILANTAANGEELVADAHIVPGAGVGEKAGDALRAYAVSNPNPTANIVFDGTKVGVQPSPVVAAFSSRGPNTVTPGILKPDVIAPGVNILAAWSGSVGPSGMPGDTRRVGFNIISGTSMSCPHVSGLAALLRAAHREWSPAAIRSALMTTAYTEYPNGKGILDVSTGSPATPLDVGAGHVDPDKAVDPGLVYDIAAADYVDFLCAINYGPMQIAALTKKRSSDVCIANRTYAVNALNYPSFSVEFPAAGGTVKHTRTLTNVGPPGTYKVTTASAAAGSTPITVAVEPKTLSFTKAGEKQGYTVSFKAGGMPSGTNGFGRLVWSGDRHVVASPIAATWT